MTNDTLTLIAKILSTVLAILVLVFGTLQAEDGSIPKSNPDPIVKIEPAPTPTASPPVGDLQVEPENPSKPGDAEETLRDETPDEVDPEVLEDAKKQNEQIGGTELNPQPVGGAQNYRVRKDFKCHAYSSRNGQRPTEFVLHFTVSPNRPGWGDVLGIRDYFCRTKIASATYIGDFEGHFLQQVPESEKPWTQGAANPTSISIEIIATGLETRQEWLDSKLFKKGLLAELMRDSMRRNGIKIVRVDPRGCIFPVGYTDHNALECGNDHTDVGLNFPWDTLKKQLARNTSRCGLKCQHEAVHKRLRKLDCRGAGRQRHPSACTKVYAENRRLHDKMRR